MIDWTKPIEIKSNTPTMETNGWVDPECVQVEIETTETINYGKPNKEVSRYYRYYVHYPLSSGCSTCQRFYPDGSCGSATFVRNKE